jgi:hypothetical protein
MSSVELIGSVLITSGLWLWMARANHAGRAWARIAATGLFGLLTAFGAGFLVLTRHADSFSTTGAQFTGGFYLLYWFVGMYTIVLLWRRSSTDYYVSVENHARSRQEHPDLSNVRSESR